MNYKELQRPDDGHAPRVIVFDIGDRRRIASCEDVSPTLLQKIGTVGKRPDNNNTRRIKLFSIAGNIVGRLPENGGNGKGYDDSGVMYTLDTIGCFCVAIIEL